MYDYLAIYETRWDEYEEIMRYEKKSEGEMNEKDGSEFMRLLKIELLHSSVASVTDIYNTAKLRFDLLPAANQVYENFRNELLSHYRGLRRDQCFI